MRTKIDYGIDLGTTNSSIARMENSEPIIKKSDMGSDVLPSCVHFNSKMGILVGETAGNAMKRENINALRNFDSEVSNSFIEFKRTMGTDHKYNCKNMDQEFSSEELSAEILKTLKSFILGEKVDSVVITVPAKFINPQKEATIKAAKLAGFKHVELLNEPVAASTAFGLNAKTNNAYWVVFDFGGGTFDAALVKAEDGILEVKDTEGDNFLGGKNLDDAIVDNIILPHLKKNFSIESIIEDENKKELLRKALKQYAEQAKIQLSFKESVHILSNLDDLPFKDENGVEPEIDINLTQKDLEEVLSPIFQKSIDITKTLIERNNLKETDISSLVLVGGPTHSPILRKMLSEQITKNVDTSIDPMTAVARGAALVASTLSVSKEVLEEKRDKTKIQLDLKYDSATVEEETLVSLKILKDQTEGGLPEMVYADIVRSEGSISSGKKVISEKATLIELPLSKGRSNLFNIKLFDETGNILECQPNQISILQGLNPGEMTTLPYHICIARHFFGEEKDLISPIKGLEKNKKIPATGIINGLKTRKEIRPGMKIDTIRIPIYQGEYNSEGTNLKLNHLVHEVIISGETLPSLLPIGSDVDLTMKVDRSERIKLKAYFPAIDHTEEVEVEVKNIETPTETYLESELNKAKEQANNLNSKDISSELETLEKELESKKGNADGRIQINENIKKLMFKLDEIEKVLEWPKVEKELNDTFFNLEDMISKIKGYPELTEKVDISKASEHVSELKKKADNIVKDKDTKAAKDLILEIVYIDYELRNTVTNSEVDANRIRSYDKNFQDFHWKDSYKARSLINEGLKQIAAGNNHVIRNILIKLYKLMPSDEINDDTLGKH